MDNKISIYKTQVTKYPVKSPFHPAVGYPEYPFIDTEPYEENHVYEAVRDCFHLLGLDEENFGKKDWNPLKNIVSPGQKIVIKPNLVISDHPLGEEGIMASVANGAIIRAVVDYVFIALQGRGEITICDTPIKEINFEKLIQILDLEGIMNYYRQKTNLAFEILDLRDLIAVRNKNNIIVSSKKVPGDPLGYSTVELGSRSLFSDIDMFHKNLRSTAGVYENIINEFHNPQSHKYSISNTVLDADTVISIAKLKTHQKSGVTLSLKNVVGISNEKRALPHHRCGPPLKGGDEYLDNATIKRRSFSCLNDFFMTRKIGKVAFRFLIPFYRYLYKSVISKISTASPENTYTEGNWYGNDTIWRTTLDLNHVLLYSNRRAVLEDKLQRKYLTLIDGIIGGDGDGPLNPTPRRCGILIAGMNAVFTDIAGATLMGFDYRKIPTLMKGLNHSPLNPDLLPPEKILIKSNMNEVHDHSLASLSVNLKFQPPRGWKGFIERES